MTTTQLHGWGLDVERGPGWIFVSLAPPQETGLHYASSGGEIAPLADDLWAIVQQHMVDRLILQMDRVTFLNSHLLGQLVLLHKRVHNHGGIIRLCGLTPANEQVLHMAGLDSRFPHYNCLDDAIRGTPLQPR
ncbi:MAG: STAS domain-containing protein [Planctomycetes bacterium]|nr:STAS domain-containing protein [Planctomycetota bacterium]